MVALQNSTHSCNITEEDTQKWKSAYANSTFTPELKAGDNNGTLPFHQKCTTNASSPINNSTHCPTTLDSTCTLVNSFPKNSTYPFSLSKNTTETCACVGVPPYTTSATSLNCTCTHDWKQNVTSPNQTSPYLFSKDCFVKLQEDNRTLDMNCTFKDCRYNLQANFFNVTLSPEQSCNDTVANATVGSTGPHSTTTPVQRSSSSAGNSSSASQGTTLPPSSKPSSASQVTTVAPSAKPSSTPETGSAGSSVSASSRTSPNVTTPVKSSQESSASITPASATSSFQPTLTSTSTHQSRVESQHTSHNTGIFESTGASQSALAQYSSSSSSVLSTNSAPSVLLLLFLFQLFVHFGLLRKVSVSHRKQKHD